MSQPATCEKNGKPLVVIVATLDTKGEEVGFLRSILEAEAIHTVVLDVGILGRPTCVADISREETARRGDSSLKALVERGDRRLAVETMARGAASIVRDMACARPPQLEGIISVGGGTGTYIAAEVMKQAPLGIPKLLVSTVASRDMSEVVGVKDVMVYHSVTDILGLNPLSRRILTNAGAAMAGMAQRSEPIRIDRPIIGLTSFGFITEGAMRSKAALEALGYDVAPFHANGTGGMALEDLVEQGLIHGVLDLALHEFADSLYGGYCGAVGPGRLESGGPTGVPRLVVPGGLDCVVLEFNSPETMPEAVKGRKVFWYDFRSGVRTGREDVIALAELISGKLNRLRAPAAVMIPMRGWSEADVTGGPLHEPETNDAFVAELEKRLRNGIPVVKVDAHINDQAFTDAATRYLDGMMRAAKFSRPVLG
jgi:uncharacterized protein (UPF0261 family)